MKAWRFMAQDREGPRGSRLDAERHGLPGQRDGQGDGRRLADEQSVKLWAQAIAASLT